MTREILIQGVPRPIHYGIRTMQEVMWRMGQDLGDLMDRPAVGLDLICEVSAAALSEGARRSGSDKRYTVDEVVDFIDDDESGELLGGLTRLFAESVAVSTAKLGKMGNALAGTETPSPPKKRPFAPVADGEVTA